MAENVIITLIERVETLTKEVQKLQAQVNKPPIVNIDTAKLATELTQQFADHRKAMENIAKRIEAATASVPRSVTTTWRIEPTTKQFMLVVIFLAAIFFAMAYMLLSSTLEESSREQRQIQARTNAAQADELNFLRRKNPKDAAQYAREHE